MKKSITYILTYNCPLQLDFFLQRLREQQPRFFTDSTIKVCNQSDEDQRPAYQKVCDKFGVEHWETANDGCSGGRVKCAKHFMETDGEVMFYFEDDMPVHEPNDWRNEFGFPYYVSDLFGAAHLIVEKESVDYIKFTFNEVGTDHTVFWSPDHVEKVYSKFTKMGFVRGGKNAVGYLIGDVFCSNWASCISREGNRKMFTSDHKNGGEVSIVRLSHKLINAGELRASVLMASAVVHQRKFDYDRTKRIDMK